MTVPGKIDAAAGRIAELWQDHRDDAYPGPDGQDAAIRGSLQLVFCDIGTPAAYARAVREWRPKIPT